MPIPDYQTLMLPLLRVAGDGVEHAFREAVERLAVEFELSDDERAERLASGTSDVFGNRVGWARSYLKQAGLIEAPRRGVFCITKEGVALLVQNPVRIDNGVLNQYSSFRTFRARGKEGEDPQKTPTVEVAPDLTPEDAMAVAYLLSRSNCERERAAENRGTSIYRWSPQRVDRSGCAPAD